jgi:DNA-binding NtrC family response regulator
MPSLLIVDDLISIHEMLEAVIAPTGFKTAFATDGEKALARYKADKFDLVLADIDMKPMDGITLLKQLKAYDPTAVIIIMTAYASTESAIQALKFGAFDYLQKPFKVDELMQALKRGLEFHRTILERETLGTAAPTVPAGDFEARLPGESPKIKRLIAQLKKLASAHTPVLISGESGSGHDVVAELLHAAGTAPGSPLIAVDCRTNTLDGIRAGLLGANGAGGTWVQEAKGGSLILRHLENLPKDAQPEMISVLRNNAHTFRLISTTEADLEKLSEEDGGFNEELFYRVGALTVHLPPLRERIEDLPVLLREAALKVTNPRFDSRQVEFADDALAALRAYRWPANQGELTQLVGGLVAATETRVITAAQLPLHVREIKDWPKLADYLAAQEKDYLARALQACGGDKARAAKALGVDVSRFA